MASSTTRAFATTPRHSSADTDPILGLSSILVDELLYEVEGKRTTREPAFLMAFREEGVWTIEDVKGSDRVTLVRKFGNETIRVMFSASDIEHVNDESEDEREGEGSGEHDHARSYPIRVSFSVIKDNAKGALNVDLTCQHGAFLVNDISFYPGAQLGTQLTAEADCARRGLYAGPRFDRLPAAVQEAFEKWLNERGVNEDLATFISQYGTLKEHKEYVEWLWNLKDVYSSMS
ncbi:mitochondrial glycoprotein [Imleria badia]|nr:mitochondrial glycoprotein [Imleria badia]